MSCRPSSRSYSDIIGAWFYSRMPFPMPIHELPFATRVETCSSTPQPRFKSGLSSTHFGTIWNTLYLIFSFARSISFSPQTNHLASGCSRSISLSPHRARGGGEPKGGGSGESGRGAAAVSNGVREIFSIGASPPSNDFR
jgi:hypothetical protein